LYFFCSFTLWSLVSGIITNIGSDQLIGVLRVFKY
jgi:hypothetical protein